VFVTAAVSWLTSPAPGAPSRKADRDPPHLWLSQNEMLARLGLANEFGRNYISAFELGTRKPPLPMLLRYSQAAGVWVDVLIDDDLELPAKLLGRMRRF